MTVLLVVIALVVLIIGYFISTQRSLVNLDELCKNALSQIEVQLNSRFDAVIALAKTAAKYAEHESDTIIKTIQARGGNSGTIPANGTSAAVAYQGQDYRTFTMGFPFECIGDSKMRNKLMYGILKFLLP